MAPVCVRRYMFFCACAEQHEDTIPPRYGVFMLFRSRLFTEKGTGKALLACQESGYE
jgi:hypothetical protein